jgi:hypothetical protein
VNIGKLDGSGVLLSRSINIHANDASKSNMTPIQPRFGSRCENMANATPTARAAKPNICLSTAELEWQIGMSEKYGVNPVSWPEEEQQAHYAQSEHGKKSGQRIGIKIAAAKLKKPA